MAPGAHGSPAMVPSAPWGRAARWLGEVFGLDGAPSSRLELGASLTCKVRACGVVWLGA